MRIEFDEVFDIHVVRLSGAFTEDIDLETGIKDAVDDENPKVLLNFEQVDYINSNCFRSLARMHHKLTANGGEMRLCCLRRNVRRLFTFAKLDTGFHIYSCEDEGITSFYSNLSGPDSFTTNISYTS